MEIITLNREAAFVRILFLAVGIFLSLNMVKGQEKFLSMFVKSNNTTETAFILAQSIEINHSKTVLVKETEDQIKIEKWMCDVDFWGSEEIEGEAVIENWMSDTNFWDEIFIGKPEQEMEIESWMLDTKFWDCNLSGSELKIENWMSNPNYWQQIKLRNENSHEMQLRIESWMSSTSFWTSL
ncbi:MAG: hypothetical protein B6I20_13110 [Bacteroidetes bacterium 4572_117]|nr:MAG: hypothetical protein B6I20_13110 [Bacteroidetes bacterium 4572_117]